MLDEVLYMEARVFREFLSRSNMKPAAANRLFNAHGIWNYIESCYDTLHMSGDECVMEDIERILETEGAVA